jgi:hypothetical protein
MGLSSPATEEDIHVLSGREVYNDSVPRGGHIGTLCLACTKILDFREERRCPASAMLFAQTVQVE